MVKLDSYDARGRIFDILRYLCAHLVIIEKSSNPFKSDLGVLQGDPWPRVAFLIYLAHRIPKPKSGDLTLHKFRVPIVSFADDVLPIQLLHESALQDRVEEFSRFCRNDLLLQLSNAAYYLDILFSKDINGGNGLENLRLHGTPFKHEDHLKYLGISFQSVDPLSCDLHIKKVAFSARRVALEFQSLKFKIGHMNGSLMIQWHTARIQQRSSLWTVHTENLRKSNVHSFTCS
jgi:hypothetical protein